MCNMYIWQRQWEKTNNNREKITKDVLVHVYTRSIHVYKYRVDTNVDTVVAFLSHWEGESEREKKKKMKIKKVEVISEEEKTNEIVAEVTMHLFIHSCVQSYKFNVWFQLFANHFFSAISLSHLHAYQQNKETQ